METRNIVLPQGGTLEIEIKPGFYEAVRKHFMLSPTQQVTDELIRMFIYGAVNNAVNNSDPSLGPDGGAREQQR